MAKFGIVAQINPEITIRLTEREALALDALAGYGFKRFIEMFYKHLGKHYLEPYETDLKSLFEKIRGDSGIGLFIERAKDARAVFGGTKVAIGQDRIDRLIELSKVIPAAATEVKPPVPNPTESGE
jgi:hypothetical protein